MVTIQTPLTALLGIDLPIIQAGMGGGLAPGRLVGAVSASGGLGTLGTAGASARYLRGEVAAIRAITDRPFAVNVLMGIQEPDGYRDELVATSIELGVPVLSFSWAGAERYFDGAKAAGIVVLHQVATTEDARRSVAAGADAVVVQGAEAGGHVAGRVGLAALVPAVVDAVAPVPVIAAGAIVDGRGLAAALALGAAGVAMGTRFLATDESGAHEYYKEELIRCAASDIVLSTLFDTDWPDFPARIIRTAFVTEWQARVSDDPTAKYAATQEIATARLADKELMIPRFCTAPPSETTVGSMAEMPMYVGQGAGSITRIEPASVVVERVASEALDVIESLGRIGTSRLQSYRST